jgi:hypothetical protein
MTVLSKFRVRTYLRAMRLKFWLELRSAKKNVQLRRVCRSLLDAEIRCLKPDLLQIGEDDHLDNIVEYVSRQLTGREILQELESVASDDLVFQLVELARKSGNVQAVIACYHAADAFFADLRKDVALKNEQLGLAKAASPELVEYDAGTIYREYGRAVARLSTLRKQLAERSAFKIEFSVASISSGIALITAIFVVSGFLYVHYFYSKMGVDVSHYFSAADYLAVSVEQIRSGAFAAAISLATFSMGIHSSSRKSKLQIKADATDRRRQTWFWCIFTIIMIGICAYSLYIDEPNFSLLRTTGLILSYWIADYLSDAFFKNPLAAMTAIVGTLIFGVNVGVAAYERSEIILKGNNKAAYLQTLRYKEASRSVEGELYGANGTYYFIYERTKKITHIVPRDQVSQIDIIKKEIKKDDQKPKQEEKTKVVLRASSLM